MSNKLSDDYKAGIPRNILDLDTITNLQLLSRYYERVFITADDLPEDAFSNYAGGREAFWEEFTEHIRPSIANGATAIIEFLQSEKYNIVCELFPDAPRWFHYAYCDAAELTNYVISGPFIVTVLEIVQKLFPKIIEKEQPDWKPGDIPISDVIPDITDPNIPLHGHSPILDSILDRAKLPSNEGSAGSAGLFDGIPAELMEVQDMSLVCSSHRFPATYVSHSKVAQSIKSALSAGDKGFSVDVQPKNATRPVRTKYTITYAGDDSMKISNKERFPKGGMAIMTAINSLLAEAAADKAVAAGDEPKDFAKYLPGTTVTIPTSYLWQRVHNKYDYTPDKETRARLEQDVDALRCLLGEIDCEEEYNNWDRLPLASFDGNLVTARNVRFRGGNGEIISGYQITDVSPDFLYSAYKGQVYLVSHATFEIMDVDKKTGLITEARVKMSEERNAILNAFFLIVRPLLDGKLTNKRISYKTVIENAGIGKSWDRMSATEKARIRDFLRCVLATWTQNEEVKMPSLRDKYRFEEYKDSKNSIAGLQLCKFTNGQKTWRATDFLPPAKRKAATKPKPKKAASSRAKNC